MAKVSKNVMEQFIKGLSVDSEGNMEVPASVVRGMFHITIKDEIVNYLKTHYTEPIKLYSTDIKKISKALVRNSTQVTYYLREIAKDKTINVCLVSTDTSVTSRIVKKLKEYFLDLGENKPINIYEVAEAIDENVSSIYACDKDRQAIVISSANYGYDDRGRKVRKINLSYQIWENAKLGM